MPKTITPYARYTRGNLILLLAFIICIVSAFVGVIAGVVALINGELLCAFVYAPLALIIDIALAVSFDRVRRLGTAVPPGPTKIT